MAKSCSGSDKFYLRADGIKIWMRSQCINLYCSMKGHTKQVVERFGGTSFDVAMVSEEQIIAADSCAFFCPTYGDQELPRPMEDFLIGLKVKNKKYLICELGNYYGYDDFTFGAGKLIRHRLNELAWEEVAPMFSLDSFPRVDWEAFDTWRNKHAI